MHFSDDILTIRPSATTRKAINSPRQSCCWLLDLPNGKLPLARWQLVSVYDGAGSLFANKVWSFLASVEDLMSSLVSPVMIYPPAYSRRSPSGRDCNMSTSTENYMLNFRATERRLCPRGTWTA